MGEDTFLRGHIAIFLYIDTSHEILSQHTFYSLQVTFNISSFPMISVLVSYTYTHTEEYSADYIRIFVRLPFSCICWYINLILFVLLCFECSFVSVVLLRLLFNNEPTINCGTKHTPTSHSIWEINLFISPLIRKTGVQSLVETYQRHKNGTWCLLA